MGPQIAGIAFDLDGTLVDSMGRFPEVYTTAIRLAGGPSLEFEDILAAFHVGSTAQLLSHFLGRGVSEAELTCFYDLAAEAAREVRAFVGVPQMLSDLKARGVPLGVFTGAARRTTELLLESCGLTALFDAVVAGDEVARPKPCAEGLLMVCDQLRLAPPNVVYVGDTQADVDCAREAGCLAVVAGWACDAARIDGADVILTSPTAIAALVTPRAQGGSPIVREPRHP